MYAKCPLCSKKSIIVQSYNNTDFFKCSGCHSVFVDPQMLPDYQTERDRYLKHNNDVNDKGYQKFIAPLVDAVLARFNGSHKGLDYGSGQLSAVTHMLRHSGYSIEMYDPFFHNRPELLEKQYDYIVCCEVMEHFHYPKQEFLKLRSMLKKGGVLICMTELFTDDVDFGSWYYKNDFTHVFFYHPKSLDYIKNEFIFAKLERDNRLIQFVV